MNPAPLMVKTVMEGKCSASLLPRSADPGTQHVSWGLRRRRICESSARMEGLAAKHELDIANLTVIDDTEIAPSPLLNSIRLNTFLVYSTNFPSYTALALIVSDPIDRRILNPI